MSAEINCSSVLKIKLIQQTPMIHFQFDEAGACPRASEVKPKLDKYLIWKWKQTNTDVPEEWYISPRDEKTQKRANEALQYKLRIDAAGEATVSLDPYPLYYGNMGDNVRNVKMLRGDAQLTVVCFNKDLLEFIKQTIPAFFQVHNFGRMQDKGFGSYLAGNDATGTHKNLTEYYKAQKCYRMAYKRNAYEQRHTTRELNMTFEEWVFDDIKTVYSIMKSGRNIPGNSSLYQRSILFKYFYQRQNLPNEKKALKDFEVSPKVMRTDTLQHIKNGDPQFAPRSENPDDYRYVRAVLGLGDHVEYIQDLNGDNRAIGRKETIKISNQDIGRMESPLFFKVVKSSDGMIVYMVARRVNEGIFDKNFTFKNMSRTTHPSLTLRTPHEFNIDVFMNFFKDEYNAIKNIRARVEEVNER